MLTGQYHLNILYMCSKSQPHCLQVANYYLHYVFCRYPPPERGGGGGGSVGSGSSYSSSDRSYGPPMDRGYGTSDRYSSADRGYSNDRGYGDRYLQMNFYSNFLNQNTVPS